MNKQQSWLDEYMSTLPLFLTLICDIDEGEYVSLLEEQELEGDE